ncbi:MAG: type II secretion system protein GspG [Acidobacteriota bacterium]|nr:type II secretion system protein GspG [Blastocatellia bacterium]MDW8413554.1 type II secretion system protein GspG [Acidobacteriota bacterium]
MICPCCGKETQPIATSCSCGARKVGPPLGEPEYVVPKVGTAILALVFAFLSLPAFLWKWLAIFGIFSILLARRAILAHKAAPLRNGGYKMAWLAFAVSSSLLLAIALYIGLGIPKYLKMQLEKQKAATRAQMYSIAIALMEYKKKHGTYPRSLSEIQADQENPIALTDYWDNKIDYQATTELATDAKAEGLPTTVVFNQYQLISNGPDGKPGTFDDIVLRDDRIVFPVPSETNDDTFFFKTPKKEVKQYVLKNSDSKSR